MGRPWWHDSYWEKDNKPKRKSNMTNRKTLVWTGLVGLSIILGVGRAGFQASVLIWLVGFVIYFCQILSNVVFARVILSWLNLNRQNILIVLLNDLTEPILSPLRRVIPRLGRFDVTPLIAMGILYVIPIIITRLVL